MKNESPSHSQTMRNLLVALAIFIVLAVLTARVAVRVMPPTGDEPHYLMTAHSLAVDGDLSLLNNYREQQYRLFYPGLLAKRTTANFDKTRELPAFGLGLSVFLAPFYWVSLNYFPAHLVLFLRLIICSITAIAVYQILSLGSRVSESVQAPLWVIPGAVFASPLITYCNQFYPEILALLLILLALRQLERLQESPWKSALWAGCIAPALLWLHPKYLILSLLVYSLCAFQFLQRYRRLRDSRSASLLVVHTVLSLAGIFSFFVFLHAEYGSWSPNRIYGGWQKQTTLLELIQQLGVERIWVMLRMLPAYWLDQRFGLILYAPLYVSFFPALIWFVRRNTSPLKWPLLILFAAHYLLLCWAAQMGGYAPPSRHFIVLIPFVLFPIVFLYTRWSTFQKILFAVFQLVGWTVSALILTHYRLIFTNATWRNPDGFSEFWSWLHLERSIPLLTATHIDFGLFALWLALLMLFSYLLYPRTNSVTQ